MNLSLSNTLGRRMALDSLDPDASGYIAAVRSAGGTVTGAQATAINNFIVSGKAAGWYSNLKRLYLPIWAAAAPNAIDMIGLTSGTFTGTVTHSSGYAQSNGTTGYFRTGTTFPAEGLSVSDGYLFGLHYTANTTAAAVNIGAGNFNTAYYFLSLTAATARWCSSASGIGLATTRTGIFSFSRKSGVRTLWRRATSGRSVVSTVTNADAGTIPVSTVLAMANNGTDLAATFTPVLYDDGQKGAYGFGLGMTDAQDTAFTSALKTMWESCTLLTLP